MKGHAAMGATILGNTQSPYLQTGAEIALNHHERWSGGGYPGGKQGEAAFGRDHGAFRDIFETYAQ